MDLGPLSDEISKRLRLDLRPASEFNGVSAELDSPLDDTAIGLFVMEDVPHREHREHDDHVILEVVAELTRCNQDGL